MLELLVFIVLYLHKVEPWKDNFRALRRMRLSVIGALVGVHFGSFQAALCHFSGFSPQLKNNEQLGILCYYNCAHLFWLVFISMFLTQIISTKHEWKISNWNVQALVIKIRSYHSVFVKLIRGHRRATFINELCKCARPTSRRPDLPTLLLAKFTITND